MPKQQPLTSPLALASLQHYLLELEESGVDGISADELRVAAEQPVAAAAPVAASGAVTVESTHETLEKIRRSLGDCHRCKLSKTRKNIVFGVGNPKARLVFVGEGPGADEDAQGEPFVGAAGKVLDRLIVTMGLKREDVYICNVVKCRPPGNRDPEADEVSACSPYLLRQLASVKPEVIVALGRPSAHTLLGIKEPISKLRGRFRDFHGTPLMPTYHPSFLLRKQGEGDTSAFWEVWGDMVQVLQMLNLPVPEKNRKR